LLKKEAAMDCPLQHEPDPNRDGDRATPFNPVAAVMLDIILSVACGVAAYAAGWHWLAVLLSFSFGGALATLAALATILAFLPRPEQAQATQVAPALRDISC